MSIGQLIYMAESIVTVCCGAVLAVRPAPARWKNKVAGWVVKGLVLILALFNATNVFWAKFSAIGYTLTMLYLFIVLFIFYKVNFWQFCVQTVIYWLNVEIFRYYAIYIGCLYRRMTFYDYITNLEIPWHWMHIASMLLTMILVIFLCYKKRGRAFIECRRKRTYIYLIVALGCERFIGELLFNNRQAFNRVQENYIVVVGMALLLIISVGVILVVMQAYFSIRQQEQIVELQYETVRKQYDLMDELYREKRRQLHNAKQNNILLLSYLENGDYDSARKYLAELLDNQNFLLKNRYTGIDVIDVMLDYKIAEASQYGIKMFLKLDVLFCPMERTDMCVVLGNLLDNAIEAAMSLKEDEKSIDVTMQTVNNMFIIEIKNAYAGKRRVVEGRYETTKSNKSQHGLGLESVQKIFNQYDGEFTIKDDGSFFIVKGGIFKNAVKKCENPVNDC